MRNPIIFTICTLAFGLGVTLGATSVSAESPSSRGGGSAYQCFNRCMASQPDLPQAAMACCERCNGNYGCNGPSSCCNR